MTFLLTIFSNFISFLPVPSPPLQRAKIGAGSKAADEKTTNAISKFDNNGSRDRMKLSDFNFLMVLGKGSFGKVWYNMRLRACCV